MLNETVSGKHTEEELVVDEATGGMIKKTLEYKKQEIKASKERSEDLLKTLKEYETGKLENATELIKIFKDFVIQITEQQKQMREREIALDRKRIREAEENRKRKRKLEKLLIGLNDKLMVDLKGKKTEDKKK